jgi:hypothetical protein
VKTSTGKDYVMEDVYDVMTIAGTHENFGWQLSDLLKVTGYPSRVKKLYLLFFSSIPFLLVDIGNEENIWAVSPLWCGNIPDDDPEYERLEKIAESELTQLKSEYGKDFLESLLMTNCDETIENGGFFSEV